MGVFTVADEYLSIFYLANDAQQFCALDELSGRKNIFSRLEHLKA